VVDRLVCVGSCLPFFPLSLFCSLFKTEGTQQKHYSPPSLPPSLTYVVSSSVHDDGGGHDGLVQLGVLLGDALCPALVEGGADDGNVLDVVPGPLLQVVGEEREGRWECVCVRRGVLRWRVADLRTQAPVWVQLRKWVSGDHGVTIKKHRETDKDSSNRGRNPTIRTRRQTTQHNTTQHAAKTYLEPIVDFAAPGKHGVAQHDSAGHGRRSRGEEEGKRSGGDTHGYGWCDGGLWVWSVCVGGGCGRRWWKR